MKIPTSFYQPPQILSILIFWILITRSLSPGNLLIGGLVAVLMPPISTRRVPIQGIIALLIATPRTLLQAMAEASSMVSQGFRSRSVIRKEPWPAWTTRDPLLQFSWVVLLALTPRTLVLSSSDEGITLHVETSR
jgi:multisubunit Na+/H+ antiporter MnhE subunit